MMTASADSSDNYEKWQMELSQSYSSSGLDYSEDTFEPFSEEEEACWQQESEPSESYCSTENLEGSAVSDTLESMSQLAGQNHAGMQSLPCLRPVFHSFKLVQWSLESAKIKM